MTENIFGSLFESIQKKQKNTVKSRDSERNLQKRQREHSNISSNDEEKSTKRSKKNEETTSFKDHMQSKSQKQEKSKSIDEEELRAELRKIIETGGSWNEEELSSSLSSEIEDSESENERSLSSEASKLSKPRNNVQISNTNNENESKSKRRQRKERTVFVGNLPLEITKLKLTEFFKSCGKIFDVRLLPQVIEGKQTCVAFIEFTSTTGAQKALKMHGSSLLGKKIQVRIANQKRKKDTEQKKEQKVFSLFVKNLDFSTTEETLRTIFEKCGEIQSIRLPVFNDSGKPRGYGFIDFKQESALNKALKLNRIEVNGRQLLLERSKSQTQK